MRWPATRRFLSIGQQAFTGFQCQEAFLVVGDVDEGILCAAASGSGRIQRRLVLVTTPIHLGHQLFVPLEKCPGLADPALRFGMVRVPARTVVHRENVPEPVEFPVLTEQMLPTELSGWDVPNSHVAILTRPE